MKAIFASILCLGFFVSCSSGGLGVAATSAPSVAAIDGAASGSSARLLKKEGRVSLKTTSLEDCALDCERIVVDHEGRLESKNLSEDSFHASIRVPTTQLEPLMEQLCELGTVTTRRMTEEDVTEQWRDLEAALANKRKLRDRLRGLLSKAQTVEEMLQVETELERVQTELDQMEGRIKSLRNQVALAEVQFTAEKKKIPGPVGVVKDGTGWFLKKLFVLN